MKWKLSTYLFVANGASILFILISLLYSYVEMLLTLRVALWLSGITVAAGVLSLLIHYVLTRPLEKAIRSIGAEAERLSQGDFGAAAPEVGPIEFQQLATRFNGMARNLESSFRRLQDSEASRRQLVANVSHDLRTPLASIQAFVEALQDDVVEDKEAFQAYLRTIRMETGRLSGMIEDLFRLSALEADGGELTPEPIPVDQLLLDVLEGSRLLLEEKQLQVTVAIADGLPQAAGMPGPLLRVMANLVQNAVRHSPDQGRLTLRAVPAAESFVEISIEDEGKGIPEIEREKVFERFYRTDASRTRDSGGAGLGLAIAKSIVEHHGGHIGIRTGVSGGAVFHFTIPVWKGSGRTRSSKRLI